jgi:hypothetical protein
MPQARALASASVRSADVRREVMAQCAKSAIVTLRGNLSATAAAARETQNPQNLDVGKLTGGKKDYVALPITPSHGVRLGQGVATIGFPNVEIQGFSPKVTRGEVSSRRRAPKQNPFLSSRPVRGRKPGRWHRMSSAFC